MQGNVPLPTIYIFLIKEMCVTNKDNKLGVFTVVSLYSSYNHMGW